MRRRVFLRLLGAGTLAVGGLALAARQRIEAVLISSRHLRALRSRIYGVDPVAAPGLLSGEEERALWTLALVVLPTAAASAEVKQLVLEHLRWRSAEVPGFRAEFTSAIAALDQRATRMTPDAARFADLSRRDAERTVAPMLRGLHAGGRRPNHLFPIDALRLTLDADFRERFRLRRHVVNEILHAYYASHLGWASVRYDVYPGACGGAEAYTRPLLPRSPAARTPGRA